MTKRAKRYSGRIASTAVVAAALGLIIWALVAFAAGSVTTDKSSYPLGTTITSTLAGGFANSKYIAEFWGPSADGGTVPSMRNYSAVVTSNGAGGATVSYTTNPATEHRGTWHARYAFNPNYTRPQYVAFDLHSSVWLGNPKTNMYYGFKLIDRNGNTILTDQSSHILIRLQASGTTVTGWSSVNPNATNGWNFDPATGIYSRRDATSRASGSYMALRVGAANNDTFMPASGTAETGDAATFNTNARYVTYTQRVGSTTSRYPIKLTPVYATVTPYKNKIVTPGATSYTNYTYYFDVMGASGAYITSTSNLTITANAYAPLASGGTTAMVSGSYTYTGGHFQVRFNLPQPNKYGIFISVTRSNYVASHFQIIDYSACSPAITVNPQPTPPTDVSNLVATPGDRQIGISWTNPPDPPNGTFNGIMILRNTSNSWPTPVDGNTYTVGGTIGSGGNSSTVVYNSTGLTASGNLGWTDGDSCNTQKMLQTGSTYYYKVIPYDSLKTYCRNSQTTGGQTGAKVPVDTTAPAPITNLTVNRQDRANQLTWTPSSDCDYFGVRIRATTNGQAAAFDGSDGSRLVGETNAYGSGTATFTDSPLPNGIMQYYTVWTKDDDNNWSATTRRAQGSPQDYIAPGQITDLTLTSTGAFTAALRWTATADNAYNALSGNATSYEIRYYNQPITDDNWSKAWVPGGASLPQPASVGTVQTYTVTGLSPMHTYYFAIRAKDEVPNASVTSNVVSSTTLCNPELTGCDQCHQLPPTDGLPGQHPRATGNIGSHNIPIHASADPNQCNTCHANGNVFRNNSLIYAYNHQDGLVEMNDDGMIGNLDQRKTKTGGSWRHFSTIVYKFREYSGTTPYKVVSGNCINTYCHGVGKGASASPMWGIENITCGEYCHEAPPATGKHVKHYHPGAYYINFAPTGISAVSGYAENDGNSGWTGTVRTADNGSNPDTGGNVDPRYATYVASSNATLTLTNLSMATTYYLTVCCGDSSQVSTAQTVQVSGDDGATWQYVKDIDNWDTTIYKMFKKAIDIPVYVADGHTTMLIKIGNGTDETKLNFLILNQSPEAPKQINTVLANTPVEYGFACGKCHSNDITQANHADHVNGAYQPGIRHAEMAFDGNSYPKNPLGVYTSIFGNATSHTDGQGFLYTTGSRCQNLYCHGNTLNAGGSNTTPVWNDGYIDVEGASICGSCHDTEYKDTTPGTNISTGSHDKHVDSNFPYYFDCYKCHNNTVSPRAADGSLSLSDKTHHVNGVVEVVFDKHDPAMEFGRYSTSQHTCYNVYCHSNGLVDPAGEPYWATTYAKPVWGSGSKSCNFCHGTTTTDGMPDYANLSTTPNSHDMHVRVNHQRCDTCHYRTVGPDGVTIKKENGATLHVNAEADVFFNPSSLGAGASFSHVTESCSNTYCHGSSNQPKWGHAIPNCGDCHGAAPASGRHDAHSRGNFRGITSAVANKSTGAAYDYSCFFCHYSRTHGSGPVSGQQVAETNFNTIAASNSYSNASGVYNPGTPMAPKENGWNWTAGTCSSTRCHSNGRGGAPNIVANWTTALGGLGCYGCHGGLDGDPYVMSTGKHLKHVSTSASKKTCEDCHALTAAANSIRDSSKHVNGSLEVSLRTGGTYDSVGHDCNTVYCHSNGSPGFDRGAANFYAPSPDWFEASATSTCTTCHSDNRYTAGDGLRTAGQTLSYNHQKHVSAYDSTDVKGYGYRFGCANCHNASAMSNTALWPNAPMHADGSKDIVFWTASTAGTGPRVPFYNMTGASTQDGGGGYWGLFTVNSASVSVNCTVICHSNGRGGNALRLPNWSSAQGSVGCTGCHGYNTATFTSMSTGAHRKHSAAAGSSLACNYCHRTTVSGAFGASYINTTGYMSNHVNGVANVDMAFNVGGTYDSVAKTCTNVACHGGPGNVTPNWTTGKLNCAGCHDSPPKYAQHFGHYSSLVLGNTTTTSNYTRNLTNQYTYKFGCGKCHLSTSISHGTGSASRGKVNQGGEIAFDFGTAPMNPLGSYTTTDELMGTDSRGLTYTKGTCRNLYCHSDGKAANTVYAMVNWSTTPAGMTCTGCHNGANTFAMMTTTMVPTNLTQPHGKHAATDKYAFACNMCHKMTASSNTAINIKSRHVDGTRQVYFTAIVNPFGSATGVYVSAAKSCRNTYCHSDGNNGHTGFAYGQQATWTGTLTCTGCHLGNAASGLPITSGKHSKHVGNGNLASFGCVACHDLTVSDDTTISNYGNHVNGVKNVNFQVLNNQTGFYVSASIGCRNNYCHSSGQTPSVTDGTPVFRTPTWTEAAWTNTCNGCHGRTSPYGAPDYANVSTADRALYNTHQVPGHVNSARDCIHCHMHTVDSFGNITTGSTQHINGTREVVFQLGGTYDPVNKYCTNVACHGFNTTPLRWGGPSQNCSNCHSDMGAGFSSAEHQYTGNHKKHTDPGTYRFACEVCHATKNATNNIAHGTGTVSWVQGAEVVFNTSTTAWRTKTYKNNTAMRYRRMDQVWDITGSTNISYTAKDMAGYDPINGDLKWTFGQCSNVWCHSSGQTAGGYVAYVNWSSTTTNCLSCHGGKTSGTLSGKHDKHVNNGDIASFGCVACHKATVSDDTTLISYDKHVNGLRDVSFQGVMSNNTGAYLAASQTCQNNYCHSSGQRTPMSNTSTFPAYRTPTWTAAAWANTCNGCHGTGNAFGAPDYANRSTASRAWFNGHMVGGHVSSASDCIHCHVGTVDASGNLAAGQTQHINGSREVSFQAGGTYDPVTKSCTGTDSTNCHGAETHEWGGWGGLNGCAMCHQASGSDVDNYVYGDSVKSMVSYEQYTAVGHGKMGRYSLTPGNKLGAAQPSYGTMQVNNCQACHDLSVPHNTSGNLFRIKNSGDSETMCGTCHAGSEANHHAFVPTGGDAWATFTPKCVDCHDPHGDIGANGRPNNAMIQALVNYTTNSSSDGIPTITKAVSFPADATLPGTLTQDSFVQADNSGICQICHRAGGDPMKYFSKDQYDTTHNGGNACGACHRHNTGFQGAGECKSCHGTGGLGTAAGRADIQKQFENSSSHHIVGSSWAAMSSKSCSFCHAEGTPDGNPGALHKSGKAVVLNVWTGIGFTNLKGFVRYTTGGGSSAGMPRSNSSILTPVCLSCHSEANKNATPFADSGDNSTPARYSWDNNSVGSKYANVSTTPWGKFNSSTLNVVPADAVNKAYSPHGNAGANQSVMSIASFSTYNSTKAVGCYDCHNGHASNVSNAATYQSGNRQGGIFKQISTANGIYQPMAGGSASTKNAYSAASALCMDCHYGDNQKAPKKYTDFGLAQGQTIAGSYYERVGATKVWSNWSTTRWSTSDTWRGSFAYKDANFKGGHFGNSMGNMQEATLNDNTVRGNKINKTGTGGSCTACHDPHGSSPAAKRGFTKPVATVATASTTGSPVIGGTVASGDINQSRVVVLQITANATNNNPSFRYSTNGGKTWTSSSSLTTTILTSISVSWNTGNYNTDDTWTFLVGANPTYMVPALKGTWMHSPYKEDRAPRSSYTTDAGPSQGGSTIRLTGITNADDFTAYQSAAATVGMGPSARRQYDGTSGGSTHVVGAPAPRANPDFRSGSYNPGYNIPAVQGDGFGRGPLRNYGKYFTNLSGMNGWNGFFIDENTFGTRSLQALYSASNTMYNMTSVNPAALPGNFAGLCLQCHAWQRNSGIALSNVTSANLGAGLHRVQTKPHETVMGMGTITANLFRRNLDYTASALQNGQNSTDSSGYYYTPLMHGLSAASVSNTHTPVPGPAGQVQFSGGTTYGATDPTGVSTIYGKYYRWAVSTSRTYTNIQATYHRFPCAKCHTPHVARLPRLMKTNCLDNDNVGVAHTTMGYVNNGTTPDTTATNLWGALFRNNACHSTKIGASSWTLKTYAPGGWNNKTPW